MGEMICVCREIDKNTGEIAVYPIKAEVTDRLLFCLGLRQRANPELKYFVTLAENYDLFSRLYIRESGNPVRSRAASLHRRRRERERSRALPFYGSYL